MCFSVLKTLISKMMIAFSWTIAYADKYALRLLIKSMRLFRGNTKHKKKSLKPSELDKSVYMSIVF